MIRKNMSGKPAAQVEINILNRLKELFEKKGWTIDENSEISTFSRYYETLKILDREQQEFLLNLSDRFIHLTVNDYLENMLEPLSKLRDEYKGANLIFLPCLPESDANKIKSSSLMIYQLKGTTIKSKIELKPFFVGDFHILKFLSNEGDSGKNMIVLVDDFIGTGETALGAVEYIHKLIPSIKDNNHIVVLSIIAMREGVNTLDSQHIKVYSKIICGRGISDEYTGVELSQATAIMHSIESKIKKLDKEMEFGYKGSEALVCMERCPNNTFPIYWKMKNIAPYER